ncbi:glutamate-5-semialdehyde dehydrogenase [Candidatus Woesearchaeota archaeon]|nr:glutamate-5-semialdehyde dehydrogenase [Candidatus Woesearchaeota archaeon]
MTILQQVRQAQQTSLALMVLNNGTKDKALHSIAAALQSHKEKIHAANKKDRDNALKSNLPQQLMKRLSIDDVKLHEMITMVGEVARLDDPCNKTLETIELDKGLVLEKVSVPIGVIGMIFESRPDALVQIACLALKSGNAVVMKGGSEAKYSNRALADIIRHASSSVSGIPNGWLQLIETREQVKEMLSLHEYIDLLIPRGSSEFVRYVMDNTKIPVLGHASGICAIYIDKDADVKQAVDVCYDAKVQYPAVCNAAENLLIHKDIAKDFLKKMVPKYLEAGVELRCDDQSYQMLATKVNNKKIRKATHTDWTTEYNNLILSVKMVTSAAEAIEFINTHGSHHTDAIVTKNKPTAEQFLSGVDSSSVLWNCSTRFADGFRYGKGAEVGIATGKIHSRGPVGVEGLVIYKYKLRGNGQVVSDYVGKNAKKFTHKKVC